MEKPKRKQRDEGMILGVIWRDTRRGVFLSEVGIILGYKNKGLILKYHFPFVSLIATVFPSNF